MSKSRMELPKATGHLTRARVLSWICDSSSQCSFADDLFRMHIPEDILASALLDWKAIVAPEDAADAHVLWSHACEQQSTCSLRIHLVGDLDGYWDICGLPQWEDGICSWRFEASEVFKHDMLPPHTQAEHAKVKSSLRRTMDILPLHAWYASPDGALQYMNRRDADSLSLPEDHPLRFGSGNPEGGPSALIRFLHPDDRARTISSWAASLRARVPHEVEARVQTPNAGFKWYLILADPMLDQDGNVICWTGVRHDIDAQKRDEEEVTASTIRMERLQRLADASRLAKSMADKMSHPILRITEQAQKAALLLSQEEYEPSAIKALLEAINSDSRTASQIVIDVRRAFNTDGLAKRATSVRELVTESLKHSHMMVSLEELNARVEINPHLRFTVDEFKIQLALRILLSRMMSASGYTEDQQLRISARVEGSENVALTFEYSGVALTLEMAEFAPFTQEVQPYDVELAVARALIHSHDGTITVRNAEDSRSAFEITLPIGG